MRIKGPGDGPRPPDAVDEAAPVDGVDEAAPSETGAVGRVGGTGGPTGPGGIDPIALIAQRLRAGELSSDEALELIIDDTIERQLGGAVPKDLEPKLREVLRDYATNDPFLAAKIRKLTQGK
ncbi:MAG: hypothetical protein JWM53_5722 [bacterium]|nr:hypothetical protein [bacterium]